MSNEFTIIIQDDRVFYNLIIEETIITYTVNLENDVIQITQETNIVPCGQTIVGPPGPQGETGPPGPQGPSGESNFKTNKELTGLKNNSNKIFNTPEPFIPFSLCLYVNGIRQKIIDDYLELDNETIEILYPPEPDTNLLIDYKI